MQQLSFTHITKTFAVIRGAVLLFIEFTNQHVTNNHTLVLVRTPNVISQLPLRVYSSLTPSAQIQACLVHFYSQGTRNGMGSCWSLADWMSHIYWMGKSKANTFSLCKVGGETGYTAQEDLKSINSYNMGEGRMIRVLFFCSCIPRPALVLSALLSLGHHRRLSFSVHQC